MNENQKAEIRPIQAPWKIFFWEAFLFSLTLGLGIATAFRIDKIFEIQKITIPQIPFWQFIFNFLLATLFLLLIIRFFKFQKGKVVIFKAIFILAVFLGGGSLLSVWLPDSISLISMAILIFWWLKNPSVLNQDILMIFGLTGVGSTLGLALQPLMVVAFLIIFSIYDFIAVYKTKHMVEMAREMIESRAILALVIPPDVSGFRASLGEIKPGGKFLILGGGDIVFPLLLCSSLISTGILNSLIVAIFSLIGLFASFYIFSHQKVRQPIPALPPIALFSILGYLLVKFLK